MSVKANGAHKAQQAEMDTVTTPRKRKHDNEAKDSSKKKKNKKQRIEEDANDTPPPAQASPIETPKKSSKKKRRDQADASPELPKEIEQTDKVNGVEVDQEEAVDAIEEDTNLEQDVLESPQVEEILADLLESSDPSSFYSTRLSLYVSIPAIALESASSSILAAHLAPLLLTYFPPAKGIVLGFSDPVLSAKPDSSANLPLIAPDSAEVRPGTEVLARTADEFGVCWTWLTVTLLTFRPERGDELYGWTNVTSEGFIGLVSYNYFQSAIGQNRIPQEWTWNGPHKDQGGERRKGRKARLRDEDGTSKEQDIDMFDEGSQSQVPAGPTDSTNEIGFFTDEDGNKVSSTLTYRVVDTEVVPGHDRHTWSLQIDGTLLNKDAEQKALEEDRLRFERIQQSGARPETSAGGAFMTGARGLSREGSVMSRLSAPVQTPSRIRR
ncbi:hypothetical protein B0A52_04117 [Exophiala mesophila]|uniref:DNA-directed RNA polymerase subunit n=1 Tax=Exophiala mesophila TaxID=212818 RepID=A0A438NAD2_EXOME|nr:hypothetical protein B0A52_04117 [Exophiala mesophila]